MKFDWSEYLNLATELAALSSDSDDVEAKLRSAVSRAYYAVFCLSRNYLRDIEKDPRLSRKNSSDINEHQYVAKEFIFHKSKNKEMIKIGENLSRLRELRNKADYADTIFNLQKDVNYALKLAQNIISVLNSLKQDTRS
jgi:uncharacterized protein (UPF0332 family)